MVSQGAKRMLIMETIAKIRRLYHVNGKGFKTIARELNLSKNTVKKIIRSDETQFKYERQEQGYPVLGSYIDKLKEKLEHDINEPKRRKRTARKIYAELILEGYEGSYDAVHDFVLQWKRENKKALPKAFIPLEFGAGEAFQFDWSEEEIKLKGILTRIKVAHIRLCYSRYFMMIAYPNEQLEMVMDAHNKAFQFFSGVCHKGIYDNMKTAVKTVLLGKQREFNKRFLQMCSHYLFEPIACTPASGWEKGQVENQVSTGRLNFFTPLISVESLEELNIILERNCIEWAKNHLHPEQKEKTVFDMYQEEMFMLIPYRGNFDNYKVENQVLSPYCFIQYATNCYSAECAYVGKPVEIRIYAKEIAIYYRDKRIGHHKRSFERYKRIYDPWHYVPLLERKPGALRNGAPFKQMDLPNGIQKVREHLSAYPDGDRRFIRILLAVMQYNLTTVENACSEALSDGGCNDTVILKKLQPPLPEVKQNTLSIQLSFPPTEDCHGYNKAYLSMHTLTEEVNYA
jgi:transposase